MKKFTSALLAILILLSCFATVSVSAVDNNETADNSVIGDLGDGYSLCYDYTPSPPWMKAFYVQYGNYVFLNHNCNGEQGHGFYVKKDGEKLMLSEAFSKGITNIEEVVSIIYSQDNSLFSTKIIDTSKVEGDWKSQYSQFDFSDNVDSSLELAEYEPGAVLVSMKSGSPEWLLSDFEIESSRLITPGSSTQNVYLVRFTEKTNEIVLKAIEVLNASPYVEYAEPDYYQYFDDVVEDIIPENPPQPTKPVETTPKASEPVEVPTEETDIFEPGSVLVMMRSGSPEWLLSDFEIESIRLLMITDSSKIFNVRFVEKTKEIVWKAIEVLNASPYVECAEPDYYQYFDDVVEDIIPENPPQPTKPVETTPKASEPSKEELEEGYVFGEVLVSFYYNAPSIADLLKDFEIESVRLITPGSSTQNVYHIKFVEKTKEIVWRAIEVLKASPYVKVAEPNFIYQIQPVLPDPETPTPPVSPRYPIPDADCLSMIKNKYGEDITKCDVYGTIGNYKICFAGVAPEGEYVFTALYYWKGLGDYTFISTAQACPYDLGVYIANKDEAYTLDDAYNNGIINDDGLKYIVEDVFKSSTCCWTACNSDAPIAPAPTPTLATEPVETTEATIPTTKSVETTATTAPKTDPDETIETTTPATEPFETTETTPSIDKTDLKTQEVFKKYIESFYTNNKHFTEDYRYENFGEYKGYKICFGGYNVVQPWEAKSRVGNYAFDLKTQMVEDKSLLGLYLVKDNQVITLANAYDNSTINNNDLDEIINIIKSCDHYENYFSIYDIINVKVGTLGDRDLYYEGVVNCPNSINLHNYYHLSESDYAYYYLDLDINGGFSFLPMSNTPLKTLYLVDRDNNTQLLFDALDSKTVTPNDVYTCLTTSKYNDSGYWFVSIAEVPIDPWADPVTTVPAPTEPVTTEPETTEPVTVAPKTTITLAKSSGTLYLKDSLKIKANIKNSTKKTTYKSSDTKIATVDSKGKVKAKMAGKAVITVTNNGVIKKFTVNVKNPKLNKKTVTVKKKGTVKVKIKGKIKGLKNYYTNTKKAKVISSKSASTLKIKGLKKGKTILKIKVSGITLKLKVKVI